MDYTVIIAVLVLILMFLGIYIYVRKKYPNKPHNYRAMFIIGITYIPLGISLKVYTISFIGIVFMIIGLVNKKKWKAELTWKDYSPAEKRVKIIAIIILGLMFIGGIVTYFMAR